jgi:rod shape-determining protein MreB
MEEILRAITATLEDTPPDLSGDIAREGILLAGGGTLLRGLPTLVTKRTGMTVSLADSPLTCVATGSGLALDHFDRLGTRSTARHAKSTANWWAVGKNAPG